MLAVKLTASLPVRTYSDQAILTCVDCFTAYPSQPIQDDNYLTKPNAAYEWLHFYDRLNTQLMSSQEWEVAPYLSSPVLAFHNLFSASAATRIFAAQHSRSNKQSNGDEDDEPVQPFSTPAAPYTAAELLKANNAALTALQSGLSIPLSRTYRSRAGMATELLPFVLRMLSPAVKPVVIQTASTDENGPKNIPTASVRRQEEKEKVARAVDAMAATGVRFERNRVETDANSRSGGGWVYRMEPGLEPLVGFETMAGTVGDTVRYAVRQVLEGEWNRRTKKESRPDSHVAGRDAGKKRKTDDGDALKNGMPKHPVRRDFFGQIIKEIPGIGNKMNPNSLAMLKPSGNDGRIWVSYHEGFSNAVKRPITFDELMRGF
jgi:chromosome transmission fidelity protein 18